MKDYIKQIYTEGFATTFYQKPINYLNSKIKNKKIFNILSSIIKIIYTIIIFTFAIFILYKKLF